MKEYAVNEGGNMIRATVLITISAIVTVVLLVIAVVSLGVRVSNLEQSQCEVWAIPQNTCEKL